VRPANHDVELRVHRRRPARPGPRTDGRHGRQRLHPVCGATRAGRTPGERRGGVRSEPGPGATRSEEHTSELQSRGHLVCRLLLPRPPRFTLFPYTTLFRSTFDPRIMTWNSEFTDAGRLGLGRGLTGDTVGSAYIPSVARLEQDVRLASGVAGFVASLGQGR